MANGVGNKMRWEERMRAVGVLSLYMHMHLGWGLTGWGLQPITYRARGCLVLANSAYGTVCLGSEAGR